MAVDSLEVNLLVESEVALVFGWVEVEDFVVYNGWVAVGIGGFGFDL